MLINRFKNDEFTKVWSVFRMHKIMFIIYQGCFMVGIPAMVIASLIEVYVFNTKEYSSSDLAYKSLVGIFIGVAIGFMNYKSYEKKYKKLTNT